MTLLQLNDNPIQFLPPEISRLESLEVLDVRILSASTLTLQLSSTRLRTLPPQVGNLRSLRRFQVRPPPLFVILLRWPIWHSSLAFPPKLDCWRTSRSSLSESQPFASNSDQVEHCGVTALPEEIGNLANLRHFVVSGPLHTYFSHPFFSR